MQNEAPNGESDFDLRQIELSRRYRELKRNKWDGVVWCESGVYYLALSLPPDWNFKTRLSLDRLDDVLTKAELTMRKPPYAERSIASQDRTTKAV